MKSTCVQSINMVEKIIKDWYQTPKSGIKIVGLLLSDYQVNNNDNLVVSKMTVIGLVSHVLDLAISFLYVFKKESSLTKECSTIPVGKTLFNFNKLSLATTCYNVIFLTFEQVFDHSDCILLVMANNSYFNHKAVYASTLKHFLNQKIERNCLVLPLHQSAI